jgi:structural maintenance of chromosome 2
MKPSEILSLIEEACGTSMYVKKRQETLDIIKKKELKIGEIMRILDEEVKPQFDNLLKEKENFDKCNLVEKEIENKQRIMYAYQYVELNQTI